MGHPPIPVGFVGLSSRPEWSWAVAAHLPYFAQSTSYKIAAPENSSVETAKEAIKVHKLEDDINAHGDIQSIHLASLAQSKGAKTLIGLQGRQDPAVLKAKQMVASGDLGDIPQTTMLFTSLWFDAVVPEPAVYGVDIENGANLMSISVGHALDALCFVLGELNGIQATLANNRPEITVGDAAGKPKGTVKKTSHDHCSVIGTLSGGGVATAVCQGGMSAVGKNFYWEITGTKGTLLLEGPMGNIQGFPPTIKFVKAEPEAKLETIEVPLATDFAYNTGKAWDAFAGDGPGEAPDFQVALTRHRMLEAIYRSNERGTREDYD